MNNIILALSILTAVIVILRIFLWIVQSPFKYPYFTYQFDVTGRRKPQIEDLIDNFLNKGKIYLIQSHNEIVQCWKEECQRRIEKSILKKLRIKQYYKCIDESNTFRFILIRQQTRYRQQNYIKSSYKVNVIDNQFSCSYMFLRDRNEELKNINYECTLREYNSKHQRKLMTKELRKKIMIRDNYTCRICGKYMPDEVGLHIDHMIPVSKGGKTIPSNLQVLCSKCNGHKYDSL